ncbi:sigma 54-interacting transcriptional regulator [Clostridium sp. YIM B02515]|uniref:Sigma 54-interacting transcriptional regulator n=1 Tax=Clostridium rhizosphaerae TaxID=2803861 RepID=A0ABS1TBW2_9CLOT|nr:sigma-54-dependent transcriptional regulator [Clostridium rhizosphaerae]MBL4936247.1 sigma 54-interacting transcriptional regulator [Clostridium rhizosphaerae]
MKKGTNKEEILRYIEEKCRRQHEKGEKTIGCDTNEIAEKLDIKRTNVSKILNELYQEGLIIKIKGKPVLYSLNFNKKASKFSMSFDNLIGSDKSLKKSVQQAKASILYPPRGLYTLLLGETGVGKTMFAELMHRFAIENCILPSNAPFITFNCADYANNPQLLLAHLFGAKKGSYTGSDKDRIGLVEKANNGILFLDEVHRLPPEGQETLFYLMDKGEYTSIGDADNVKKSSVLIICATTEDVDTSLLSTFTRRIPINITIPPLRDRTFEERYELVCEFLKIESARIGREIIVSPNSLRCLLLYNCPGNVGQLKSDIQLGCANAFLKCVSRKEKNIRLHSTDFTAQVKQGLILYKSYSDQIDKIVDSSKRLSFSAAGIEEILEIDKTKLPDNFYEDIEDRIQELQERGVDEEDINVLMSLEIENYFRELVGDTQRQVNKEELSKLVDKKIIDLVEEFLSYAGVKLGKVFPNKTFYGLCLHISSSIERLKSGKKVINHNLKRIIEENKEEYVLALNFATKLEKQFNIKLPVDEVGFIAMFLTLGKNSDTEESCIPIVVVAMHGRHTASSMMEVAQKLVGAYNIYAYDMSLDKNAKEAYQELKEIIVKNHRGAGVLLLVDMGSLKMFGNLIEEETGIKIKVLEMASTITVIECARKSLIEYDIDNIWYSVNESHSNFFNSSLHSLSENFMAKKDKLIITVCTTGEGSALTLKEMIEKKLKLPKNVQVMALTINNTKEFYSSVNKLAKDKKIAAIVGTFNPDIYGIPFVSISQMFSEEGVSLLKSLINGNDVSEYAWIIENYKEEIDGSIDVEEYKNICLSTISFIQTKLGFEVSEEIATGVVLHLICAIKRLINGTDSPECEVKAKLYENYKLQLLKLKKFMNSISKNINISFNDDEVCFVLRSVLEI